MNERRELAVIQGENRFYLGPKQEKQLIDAAGRYLSKSRIVVGSDTMRSGVAVMLDSLSRGMLAEGRGLLKKGEGLKVFLDRGLEERELVRRRAVAIINRDNDLPTTTHFGQYAINLELYNGAREEIKTFSLRADIHHIEKLVREDSSREQMIDIFWRKGFELLPEQLVERVRNRDWKNSEKASFVRNIIVSAKYGRGNPTPIISLDDLNAFLDSDENARETGSSSNFLEEFFKADDEKKKEFVGDFSSQVTETIDGSSSLRTSEKASIYRRLSGVFMLLHPYLEETPIVTTQRKDDAQISIWDEGYYSVVAGYRVPTREILILALRQAIARRDKPQIDQLSKGISAWSWVKSERRKKEISIAAQTERLKKAQKEYEELDIDGVEVKSIAGLNVLINDRRDIQSRISVLRQAIRTGVNAEAAESLRLENSRELVQFAEQAVDESDRFVLPRDAYLNVLKNRQNSLTISIRMAERDVKQLEEIIVGYMDMFGGRRNFMSTVGYFEAALRGGAGLYADKIDKILAILENVKDSKSDHFFLIGDERSKRALVESAKAEVARLLNDRTYRKHTIGIGALKRAELFRLETELDEGVLGSNTLNMLSRVYRGKSINTYREMRRGLRRIVFNEREVDDLKSKRELYAHLTVPLPQDAGQSFKNVMSEFQEAVIANLPEDVERFSDEEIKIFLGMNLESIKHLLPKIVSKINFKVAVSESKSDISDLAEKLKAKVDAYSEEERAGKKWKQIKSEENALEKYKILIRNLELFLHFADSSLLDLDKAEGLSLSNYRSKILRRKNLLHYRLLRPQHEMKLGELEEQVAEVDRKMRIRSVVDKKEKVSISLSETQKKDEQETFIATMIPLGLAYKDDSK